MEHIAALLLIIGCSGDLGECRELPAPVPLFEAAGQCELERGSALRGMSSDAARVFATCIEVDPAMSEEDAELIWDVTDKDGLVASIEFADPSMPALVAGQSVDTMTTASVGR